MNFKKNITRVKEMLNLKNTKHMQLVYIRAKDRSSDRLILVQNTITSSPFFAFCLLVCLFLFLVCVCLCVCVSVPMSVSVYPCVWYLWAYVLFFLFFVFDFRFVFWVVCKFSVCVLCRFSCFHFLYFFYFLFFFCFFVCCFFIISKDGDCIHQKHLPEVKIKITYNVPVTKWLFKVNLRNRRLTKV